MDIHPVTTAQTAVMRFRITHEPFDNPKLRQAVAACMDHQEILDKAFQGRGQIAENHHVCPIHPEYAALPPLKRDIEKAKALLAEAGYPDGITLEIANGDTEGPWMTDACAIFKNQAAPAGINIDINKMPANQYWEVWDKAPWGYTAWTHRPLGTMVLGLAYRKGVPWNEVAYDNPALRRGTRRCRGHPRRRRAQEEDGGLPEASAGRRDYPAALLAFGLQGSEQAGEGAPRPTRRCTTSSTTCGWTVKRRSGAGGASLPHRVFRLSGCLWSKIASRRRSPA